MRRHAPLHRKRPLRNGLRGLALTAATPDAARAVSVAKAYCSDKGREVCNRGVQVHGGIGFTWEHDLHLTSSASRSASFSSATPLTIANKSRNRFWNICRAPELSLAHLNVCAPIEGTMGHVPSRPQGTLHRKCGLPRPYLKLTFNPIGLHPPAQACEGRATLGNRPRSANPERVVSAPPLHEQGKNAVTLSGLTSLRHRKTK